MCIGCRLGMARMLPAAARKNRVPVVITGSNPIDATSFKTLIMARNPGKSNKRIDLFLGYLANVIQNPMWAMNLPCLVIQLKEYYYHYYRRAGWEKGLTGIAPFYSYIRWEEDLIVSTIKKELGWGATPGAESTWRGDCEVALVKLYLYKRTLGFNDRDEGLSYLIRDNQVTREEALARLDREGDISEVVVEEIFDRYGLDFGALKRALEPFQELLGAEHRPRGALGM